MTLLDAFTLAHVTLSLIGIAAGYVLLWGWLSGRTYEGWLRTFLATTIATSVTGFGFPVDRVMPSHIFGLISLVVLGLALVARNKHGLAHHWRRVFVICSAIALYLNSFVGIVQAFLKIPALKAMAPTQAEAPFAIAQLALLVFVTGLTILIEFRFRQMPVRPA